MAFSKPQGVDIVKQSDPILGYLARQDATERGIKRNFERQARNLVENRDDDDELPPEYTVLLVKIKRAGDGKRAYNLDVPRFKKVCFTTRGKLQAEGKKFLSKLRSGEQVLDYCQAKIVVNPDNKEISQELGLDKLADQILNPQKRQKCAEDDEDPTLSDFVDQLLSQGHVVTTASYSSSSSLLPAEASLVSISSFLENSTHSNEIGLYLNFETELDIFKRDYTIFITAFFFIVNMYILIVS
jgi:hypothetical protein